MEGFFNFVSLEKTVRYTLGKEERLKSRKAIEHLFKEGRSFSLYPLRIIYLLTDHPNPMEAGRLQAGFTVSIKYFRKAVDRNRIKRLIKEAYRLQKNDIQIKMQHNTKKLTIFFIYTAKELPKYTVILNRMSEALKQISKITDESA